MKLSVHTNCFFEDMQVLFFFLAAPKFWTSLVDIIPDMHISFFEVKFYFLAYTRKCGTARQMEIIAKFQTYQTSFPTKEIYC